MPHSCPRCAELQEEIDYLKERLGEQTNTLDVDEFCLKANCRKKVADIILSLYSANGRTLPQWVLEELCTESSNPKNYVTLLIHYARHILGPDTIINVKARGYMMSPKGIDAVDAIFERDYVIEKKTRIKDGTVLNADIVRILRTSDRPSKDLAAEYGVSSALVSQIRHRKKWQWVPDEPGTAPSAGQPRIIIKKSPASQSELFSFDTQEQFDLFQEIAPTHIKKPAESVKIVEIPRKVIVHRDSKLTREQVIAIRQDKRTYREIAESYGVSNALISKIMTNGIYARSDYWPDGIVNVQRRQSKRQVSDDTEEYLWPWPH